MLQQLLLIFHVLVSIALIILVLMQQGKGAEMGATFGSGASQTLFGSQGSTSFLLKLTGCFAFLFFGTSLWLCYLAGHHKTVDPIANLAQLAQERPVNSIADAGTKKPMNLPNAGVPLSTDNNEVRSHT